MKLASERRLVEEIDERAPTVDLDDGQPLTVGGLELVDTRDIDLGIVEAELLAQPLELRPRPVAQRASLRVIEADLRQG